MSAKIEEKRGYVKKCTFYSKSKTD